MRQSILDEAGRLLREKGLAAVSLRAIARELGYSPAALYEYFTGIDEILKLLYFEGVDGLDGRMRRAIEEPKESNSVIPKIRALGHSYRTYAHSQPDLFRLQFSEYKVADSREHDESSPGFGVLIQTIEEGIASGELLDKPAIVLGMFLWANVHGFVVLEISKHIDTGANDDLFEVVLDCSIRGVARSTSAKR
jgi:AcrR family transcriptional regulator